MIITMRKTNDINYKRMFFCKKEAFFEQNVEFVSILIILGKVSPLSKSAVAFNFGNTC